MINRLFFAILLLVFCLASAKAQVQFIGNSKSVYTEAPNASTGLNAIYVLYETSGVSIKYTAKNVQATVNWYKFGASGGGYAEAIESIRKTGADTELSQVIPNSGYIIEEGTDRTYFWVVDYSTYYLNMEGISFDSQQDCGTVNINVSGSGSDINYYTINGALKKLDREIQLKYNNLSWDSDKKLWQEITETESYDIFKNSISLPVPYCNTTYTLSGDKFLQYWGLEQTITSDTYCTSAVSVETTAVQESRSNTNEKKSDSETGFGGSAPITITFTAYCTDAVAHKEWQMSQDSEFKDITLRLNEEEVTQTFDEAGTYYMRFVGSNSDGSCSAESETYTITTATSSIECPNVFSPQSSEGVNDEWKVSYKSIVEFKCWIFNKWGLKMCEFSDPSQGWDGKYKGKYVKSGVYYYVIQARGADGQSYNLKGDINIINYSNKSSSTSQSE